MQVDRVAGTTRSTCIILYFFYYSFYLTRSFSERAK